MTSRSEQTGSAAEECRPVVAAFDVDGTLTVRDCVRPFLVTVGGWRGIVWSLVRRPTRTVVAAVRRDRDALKELVVGGVLSGRRVEQVESTGARFAERVAASWLRADTVGRLRWHQERGHRTVLVSASLSPYLVPLGRHLGVDEVLCAEPRRVGDVFADGLAGANCRRQEKVRRLEAWLASMDVRDVTLWAYGDSAGDRELLARADHGVLVRRSTIAAIPVGYES